MNTLIIHPEDTTTDFLKPIYQNISGTTVITKNASKRDVLEMIYENDRVLMMGHGSPSGLFSIGKFKSNDAFIIDESMTDALKQKRDNVFIWCNADKFVEKYNLKGFYSGMFISEVGEANYCGLPGTLQETVTESNNAFAKWLGNVINKPLYETYQTILNEYKTLAKNNPVAQYNSQRLYLAE